MKRKKIVADLNGKKIVITKKCDDCEAHPVKRGKYLPPCNTPVVGNYKPPKPLEKRIPYEEANAPIRAIPFNLIPCSKKDIDYINLDVVNADREQQDTKD